MHHLHALIAGTQLLSVTEVAGAWGLGKTDVDVYDPARRAAWYISKTLYQDDQHWRRFEQSKRLPKVTRAIGSAHLGHASTFH